RTSIRVSLRNTRLFKGLTQLASNIEFVLYFIVMTNTTKTYQKLFDHSRHIQLLTSIDYVLEWDQETYMPAGSYAFRAEQIELITGFNHKERTSNEYTNTLGLLIDFEKGQIKKNALHEHNPTDKIQWWKEWKRHTALQNEFVKNFAQLTANALPSWREAK